MSLFIQYLRFGQLKLTGGWIRRHKDSFRRRKKNGTKKAKPRPMKCKSVDFPRVMRDPKKKPIMTKQVSERPALWAAFQPGLAPMDVLTWRVIYGNGHGVFGGKISSTQNLFTHMNRYPRGRICQQTQISPVCCGAARSTAPRAACGAPSGSGATRATGTRASVSGVCALPIPLYSDYSGLCYYG